jgi:phage baseplate assembly protein W
MNPNFGTIIWGMLFEPFTPELKNMIIEDIRRIVSYEPRLGLNQLIVQEYYNGIQIDITVTYKTENFVDTIRMSFDKNSATNAMGK